jgi:hypothetical protein
MTTIQCPCGAVTMELTGDPLACVYCHCQGCQTAHGAAYLPAAMYRYEQTRILGGEPLLWCRTTTTRATCPRCGTRLFAEPPGQWLRSITAYLLPPGVFQPTLHMQCQDALLPVKDDLPHYKGFPALFGGSDELVAW